MSCICVGPNGAGKTHLLTALKNSKSVDNTTNSVPTNGINIFNIRILNPILLNPDGTPNTNTSNNKKEKFIKILEIGGSMAPMWKKYFDNVQKLIYVVDTSNLCQISAAGVLLYSALAEPRLQKTKFLLVLSKMDLAYRQMRNEALLMLQMNKLKKQITQELTIVEASAIDQVGFDEIYKWLGK